MELKYTIYLYAAICVTVLFAAMVLFYKNKKKKRDAIMLANAELYMDDNYSHGKRVRYIILRIILILSVAGMIICTGILLARPYYTRKIKETKYNRDIILCMDISTSVDELNLKLVDELIDTVKNLSGERIGIVIFNTSAVAISPLTDDYEYTIKQLENIKTAIKKLGRDYGIGDDWYEWHQFLYSGTLVGNDERGSSLIADGLMGGLFEFPDESDRTKIMIFSTDNDPQGESYLTLSEAAAYCKRHDVTVYGIGTRSMETLNRIEMEEAVNITGGKFFLEENKSTFHEIVDEIESMSADLIEGNTVIKLVESPEKYYVMLLICFVIFSLVSLILKRGNILWIVGDAAMAALLVVTYVLAIKPAHLYSVGPDKYGREESGVRVMFVVDNTLSMLANDMDGERMMRAKEDIEYIVDELDGARFCVIAFGNSARLAMPYTYNGQNAVSAAKGLYPLEYYYSCGSSLDVPTELMIEHAGGSTDTAERTLPTAFGDSLSDIGKNKTYLFYISDGEVTIKKASFPDVEKLSPLFEGGAVLGYGTREGGTMRHKHYWDDEYDEILDFSDYPSSPAVSRINEDNLNKLADGIGIRYVNMNDRSGLDAVINEIRSEIDITKSIKVSEVKSEYGVTEYVEPPKYYGFMALIPFMVLVIINAAYIVYIK